MKNLLWGLMLFTNFAAVSAQQDSIYIHVALHESSNLITVNQEIAYTNRTATPLHNIKLLNWVAAYKPQTTELAHRKLEDRKNDLYFAKNSALGKLQQLDATIGNNKVPVQHLNDENIYFPLTEPLDPGEKITVKLQYQLLLPSTDFTGYGFAPGTWALKYFFLAPDSFETHEQTPRFYTDTEENQSPGNYWKIILDVPANHFSQSNLPAKASNYFEGTLSGDPEILISANKNPVIIAQVGNQQVSVAFGYALTESEKEHLEFYLPLHLKYIQEKTGFLPQKIFISSKFRKNESFIGIDDIDFWKFHYQLFSEKEQVDLTYFSIISKNVIEQAAITEKNTNHWIINGLKTHLEIQYIDENYPDRKLLGDLPENVKIFGMKPLKFFYASKLRLAERYGLAYQYMITQNLDQAINEPFQNLSNFNATAISHFETGTLFSFLAEKMGQEKFDAFLKNFLAQKKEQQITQEDFLDQLTVASGYSAEFLETFINHKNRVNFKLKRYYKKSDALELKISKNTALSIPFVIETENAEGKTETFWFDTDHNKGNKLYKIPLTEAEKIVINDDYTFPESNFRDNYLYTKGLFANTKRIKLRLFNDIPNPEYNEIYLNPRINFNAYDKVLVGVNLRNTSFFNRKFVYSLTPYFSSGTGKLTGSGGIAYSFQPAESFYRSLDIGFSASHFHYDYDLTYQKFSTFANINFSKDPRSAIGRSLAFSYNYFEKDLNPLLDPEKEYGKYNLWSLGYSYADRRAIHEKYFGTNLQWMEDFQKIMAEASYRWEFAKDKKIFFRFFGGYFLTNKTKNNLFDYGISRVSNYSFSYGLLGQSATSGLLSQQLILAEGGFKSNVGNTANQWITSVNVDSHVWRWFNIYADAGMYKSKHRKAEFIWDSGIKVKVIPDFLEVYFPIQSSLGFEPSYKDYAQRIRFTLMLNFSAITDYFRRGWF
ncbi:aminopeptidase [Chryseobacterium sp. 6424]|uniref:aminopeptidase n=1 Tax=Chryseobacterium sp. 6424 TaxID=2039166 RepID=UPI001E431482|nr:aminopeptidase [Chryseobacterium sp. 6424]